MFIVSLHRHLKKKGTTMNTLQTHHTMNTLRSRYGHVHDAREMLA